MKNVPEEQKVLSNPFKRGRVIAHAHILLHHSKAQDPEDVKKIFLLTIF